MFVEHDFAARLTCPRCLFYLEEQFAHRVVLAFSLLAQRHNVDGLEQFGLHLFLLTHKFERYLGFVQLHGGLVEFPPLHGGIGLAVEEVAQPHLVGIFGLRLLADDDVAAHEAGGARPRVFEHQVLLDHPLVQHSEPLVLPLRQLRVLAVDPVFEHLHIHVFQTLVLLVLGQTVIGVVLVGEEPFVFHG